MADAPTPEVLAKRRLVRRMVAVATPVVVLLAVVIGHRAIVAWWIRHRAAGLGVDLAFDAYALSDGTVKLTGATAKLDGVRGLTVRAARVTLQRKGAGVASVEAADVKVLIEGSATDRVLELSAWSGENADTYRLPGSARGVSVEWIAEEGASPWLTVSGGALTSDGKSARFTASSTTAGGVPLGAVGATFAVDASGVSIELGKGATEAPITARLTTTPRPPKVEITLRPVRVEALGAALGLRLPAPDALASGKAELTLGKRGSTEAIQGSADLALEGWSPPVPREAAGIVGKKTAVTTKIAVAADRSKVSLSDVVVRNGKLVLKGTGTVTRAGDHANVRMDLAGPVACAEVMKSAGGFLGGLAGGVVEGSVSVNVSIDADSRDLKAAKIRPKIGVGCGLKSPF